MQCRGEDGVDSNEGDGALGGVPACWRRACVLAACLCVVGACLRAVKACLCAVGVSYDVVTHALVVEARPVIGKPRRHNTQARRYVVRRPHGGGRALVAGLGNTCLGDRAVAHEPGAQAFGRVGPRQWAWGLEHVPAGRGPDTTRAPTLVGRRSRC